MSGVKISALPAIVAPALSDVFPVVQGGVTYKETITQLSTLLGMTAGILDLAHGGTNANLTAVNGGIVYSNATAFAISAAGSAGQILRSAGAATPVWSTATFPATAGTAGKILISDGTNYITSTSIWPNTVGTAGKLLRSDGTSNAYSTSTFADTYAINTILYNASANTVSGLATANSSALVTSAGGVPSLSTVLPALTTTDPVVAQGIATKAYVDAVAQGLNPKPASAAASTTALTVTYANGSSGVGATLTNNGAQAAFAIDGYTASLNDVILIKDQSSTLQNGLYTLTTVGSGASNWVLTRSVFMDAPSEFLGGYTFVINGTVNAGRSFVETATVATVGTDPVTFTQFSQSKQLSVVVQVFAATATYTPTSGMVNCLVQGCGSGGGSGGVATGGAGTAGSGQNGAGASYGQKLYTAAEIGANAAITINAAGTGGAAGNNPGTAGGNATFDPAGTGGTLTCNGGGNGNGYTAAATALFSGPTNGASAGSGGDINLVGGDSDTSITLAAGVATYSGDGGGTFFCPNGGHATTATGNATGDGTSPSATQYGCGASGASVAGTGANAAGAAGMTGVFIVTEYVLT